MARKSKRSKHKKKVTTSSSQFDKWFDLVGHQIFQGNYLEAVANCERLLNYLPPRAPQRVDVLAQMGTAQGMLQNFPQSKELLLSWNSEVTVMLSTPSPHQASVALTQQAPLRKRNHVILFP